MVGGTDPLLEKGPEGAKKRPAYRPARSAGASTVSGPREGTEEQTPRGQSRKATSLRDLAVGESP